MLPNGLIGHLYGPVPGNRHDSGILTMSGLLTDVDTFVPNGFYLYGDCAYPLKHNLITPFKGANLSENEKAFNKAMPGLRVSG